MDFSRRICSEEGKDGPIGWKGHCHDLLGFGGNIPHGFFGEKTHDHGALLQWIIGLIQWEIGRDTVPFGNKKSVFILRQRTSSLIFNRRGQIAWIALQIAAASTVLDPPDSLRLLSVTQHENLARGKENSARTRRSSLKQKPVIKSLTNRIF